MSKSPGIPVFGSALQHATEELKGDREIVMTALSQDGHALTDPRVELKGDREMMMLAVSENGLALRCAIEGLRGDPGIVIMTQAMLFNLPPRS